jgi:vacuolar-type H+-ATPase subunit H
MEFKKPNNSENFKSGILDLQEENKSSILRGESAVARELARQCLKECKGKTEEEKKDIIYRAKERIISSQVEKGRSGEEIEETISNFNRMLEHEIKEHIGEKESWQETLDFLGSIPDKTKNSNSDLEREDGTAA